VYEREQDWRRIDCSSRERNGRPVGRPYICASVRLCGQGGRSALTHGVTARRPLPPHEGGYLQATRSRAAARPRFESPRRKRAAKSSGPAAWRPFVSSEVAPAASGRVSVACQVSGGGGWLIHHPSTVDCLASLREDGRTRSSPPRSANGNATSSSAECGPIAAGPGRCIPQRGPNATERELRASGWSVRAPAPSSVPSAAGKVDASICKPSSRARAARTGETHAAETSRSRQQSVAPKWARLLPAAVPEREQPEREEQQWQEENMPTAHHEHDHGNRKADRKHTHLTDRSLTAHLGEPAPRKGGRRVAVRPLLRFALLNVAPPGACFFVAVLDQLLEPLQVAMYLPLDDA
jgi:hypothetical protein